MFILDKSKFWDSDLRNAKEFVAFWSEYYSYKIRAFKSGDSISYINELNLKNDLTEQNVKRLLRWKDPRWLTEETLSGPGGSKNDRVKRVLNKLRSINDFRNGRIGENSFLKIVKNIFPNGLIWQVFLFHIACPYEFPIADQNVFQAFSIQNNNKIPEDWEGYKKYKDFFFDIAKSAGIIEIQSKESENNISEIVPALKKVDNALFIFGQFLRKYGDKKNSMHRLTERI